MARRNKTDPTGQARTRRRGRSQLQSRLARVQRWALSTFRAIPRTRRTEAPIANADATVVYAYRITPAELEALRAELSRLLEDELLGTQGDRPPPDWYWRSTIEQPYRQGALEEANRMGVLIAGAVAAGVHVDPFGLNATPEQFLTTLEYRRGLAVRTGDNFNAIKGLSEQTTAQVMRVISAGIEAGRTPTQIAEGIRKRFDVSKASATRIADTEINRVYNDGKLIAVREIANRAGLRPGVIHVSALLTTTRDHHAQRHGNAYTPDAQQQWWDEGANRINCHCSTISVLIDRNGDVVQAETREEIRAEREFFG